ncbi:MAG: trypsin-like peptidase domain-containing protein [Planctomycetota bacterium]
MITANSMLLMSLLAANPSVEFLEFTAPWCGSCQTMKPAVERLVNEGAPIRVIDFDRNRRMAKQYNVEKLPTVVALVDGKVVDRIVGSTDYAALRRRMIGIVRAHQRPDQVASNAKSRAIVRGQQSDIEKPRGLRNPLSALADRMRQAQPTQELAQVDEYPLATYPPPSGDVIFSTEVPVNPPVASAPQNANGDGQLEFMVNGRPGQVTSGERLVMQQAMAATVRIRIKDSTGVSLGSGTIVDIHDDEALVLTCGHIFQSSNGKGEILCDLFAPHAQPNIRGKLIGYNVKRDIGLISIRPGVRVTAAKIGGTGCSPSRRDPAFSIGCNRGANPTVIRDRVLDINRYLGPANIVVGGRPVQGRSGGGLFNMQGELIGVCNAADPNADEGLYAALGPIHAELDSAGLSFIYRNQQPTLARANAPLATPNRPQSGNNQPAQSPNSYSPMRNDGNELQPKEGARRSVPMPSRFASNPQSPAAQEGGPVRGQAIAGSARGSRLRRGSSR